MPLQVGTSCYATLADAGRAACSQFQTVSSVSDFYASTLSCASADASTGALNLSIVKTNLSNGVVTTSSTQQLLNFPPCVQQDYIEAAEVIAGALFALWVIWYTGFKLLNVFNTHRGENV